MLSFLKFYIVLYVIFYFFPGYCSGKENESLFLLELRLFELRLILKLSRSIILLDRFCFLIEGGRIFSVEEDENDSSLFICDFSIYFGHGEHSLSSSDSLMH